jgi:hypothetical protein
VSSKVPTFVRKSFYSKISKLQKVSHQEKINWKSANLSKCTDPLKVPLQDFIKISLKIFEQEMRKIFNIFPNSFDRKSQKNVIWFFKYHIRNMWSPTRKVKVAILKSFFRWFENTVKKIWWKIKTFFYNARNFFRKFLIICGIPKV